MNPKDIRITFFQVSNDQETRQAILSLAQDYFEKREPLLIRVPHQQALEYVDLLLWRSPQDSFLPHVVQDTPCSDLITLTTTTTNPNSARSVLNLSKGGVPNESLTFRRIYEFEDMKNSQKNKIAQDKYIFYRNFGCSITLI